MIPSDDLEVLLRAGAARPATVFACVDETDIDHGELIAYRRHAIAPDRSDAIERHLVSCPHCRDLLGAIADEEQSSRVPYWTLVAAAVAAAAALTVVVQTLDDPGVGAYRIGEISGQRSADRSQGVALDAFSATSQMFVRIEPRFDEEPAAHAAAFVRRGDRPLVRIAPEFLTYELGGVFVLEGVALSVLGRDPGAYTLHVAVSQHDDFAGLEGQRLDEIDPPRGVRLVAPFDFDYSGASP